MILNLFYSIYLYSLGIGKSHSFNALVDYMLSQPNLFENRKVLYFPSTVIGKRAIIHCLKHITFRDTSDPFCQMICQVLDNYRQETQIHVIKLQHLDHQTIITQFVKKLGSNNYPDLLLWIIDHLCHMHAILIVDQMFPKTGGQRSIQNLLVDSTFDFPTILGCSFHSSSNFDFGGDQGEGQFLFFSSKMNDFQALNFLIEERNYLRINSSQSSQIPIESSVIGESGEKEEEEEVIDEERVSVSLLSSGGGEGGVLNQIAKLDELIECGCVYLNHRHHISSLEGGEADSVRLWQTLRNISGLLPIELSKICNACTKWSNYERTLEEILEIRGDEIIRHTELNFYQFLTSDPPKHYANDTMKTYCYKLDECWGYPDTLPTKTFNKDFWSSIDFRFVTCRLAPVDESYHESQLCALAPLSNPVSIGIKMVLHFYSFLLIFVV